VFIGFVHFYLVLYVSLNFLLMLSESIGDCFHASSYGTFCFDYVP